MPQAGVRSSSRSSPLPLGRAALAALVGSAALASLAAPAAADPHERPSQGALNGKRLFISPGHGINWKDSLNAFAFDRGITHGLREDISNAQICIDFLIPMLLDAGAEVVTPRERTYQTNEVIVDNDTSGSTDYRESGSWAQGSGTGYRRSTQDGFDTGTYRYATTATSETAVATFTPTIPAAGVYPVYLAWSASANRASDALVRIVHSGGTTTVRVDQRSQGSRWVFLGAFYFEAGRGGRVEVSNRSATSGAVVTADAVRWGGGMGTILQNGRISGRPRWEEHGGLYSLYSGASHLASYSTLRRNPEYCNWWGGCDLYLMWHSNASSGGARGTVSFWYDVAKPLSPESRRLAESLHAPIVQHAKALDPTWVDRGVKTQLANWTEMVYTIDQRPVALVESAFHDNVDDAEQLRDPKIRRALARGAMKGIVRYFRGAGASVPPLPPRNLRVTNEAGGVVRVAWDWQQDALDPTAAAPTGARVYTSANGYGFDDGVAAPSGATHVDLVGLAPGEVVFVKVTQTNAGGESRPSEVLGARRPASGAPQAEVVIVNGFDRLDERVNVRDRQNTFDYVIQHADALARSGGLGFDSAANEAVSAGRIDLNDYALALWVLGQESTADDTFDPGERAVVTTFLDRGGKLFASGAEVGWDLDFKANDRAWFRDTFGARFVRDSAGEHAGGGLAGTPFAGVSFTYDDGTRGVYAVPYADVIDPDGPSARAVLAYTSAGNAAVWNAAPTRQAVLLGFPLETAPAVERASILDAAVRSLGVVAGSGGSTGGGSTGGGSTGGGSTGGGSTGGGSTGGGSTGGGSTGGGSTGGQGQTTPPSSGPTVVAVEKSGGCVAGAPGATDAAPLFTLALALALGAGRAARGRRVRTRGPGATL